ncbi:RNA methyltransferase [Carnobacteriaceae bacterium zg-C25]|nr:RNA methyltransferase [Carnobacteriaceae bacterium zg-C25]
MITYLTSVQNPRVKSWKKLHTAKGRKKEQRYLIETWHLVEEAHRANQLIECMLTQEAYDTYGSQLTVPISIISNDVMNELTQTQTPTGVFGVVKTSIQQSVDKKGKYILLDGVQDPGNVGTIIRTADAAGFDGVIIGEGTVDVFNDKTVRAMQGSQFHIALYKGELVTVIEQLQQQNTRVLATALDATSQDLLTVEKSDNVAIVVGNEGSGVSTNVLEKCNQTVYIRMLGQAESLNVAVAAGIAMYHFIGEKV